ncbi:MAG TPA: hypothetical protein VJY41_01255 [Prolixibacteraceae bacterium]|nr:hypothetical protein [Prolixibacteraceae bacterium]
MVNQNTNKQFKWGKFFMWFFIALLLLITISVTYLIFNIEKLISDNLSQIIYNNTDHNYRLNFDSFTIDLPSNSIKFEHISIKPDSTIIGDSLKTLYRFSTDELKMSKIDWSVLFFERRFKVEKIVIKQPNLKLDTGQEVNIDQLSGTAIQKGDYLELPFINDIFVDTILISNVKLSIDSLFSPIENLPQINIEINHLKIGGTKLTDYPFPFDVSDIKLSINDFNDILPDSIHKISIDNVSFSIFTSTITAKKALLEPLSDSLKNENRYHIFMPYIELTSNHLSNIFYSDTIDFTTLEISEPIIDIKFGEKVEKGTPLNEIDLYKLVERRFKWIKIDRFSIKNSAVTLTPSNSDSIAQRFDQFNIDFYEFKADSSSFKNTERIFSARDFEIDLKLLTINHTDKVHRLLIEDINASSTKNIAQTGNIIFKPLQNAKISNVNATININSKGATFNGIDFHQMYHQQIIPLTELVIDEPETIIGFKRQKNKSRKNRDKSLILEKTEDYLKGIYVDKTVIKNGSLRYNYLTEEDKSGFFRSNFNFELSQLSVDSVTFYQTDKIFFADHFELKFSNMVLQLADEIHQLTVDSLNLSSSEQSADIFDLRLFPTKYDELKAQADSTQNNAFFNIHFPRVQLSGANLHQAFFYKRLYINSFNIYDPVFNLEKFGAWAKPEKKNEEEKTDYENEMYHLISDYMSSINIRNLSMSNGKLNLIQHKNSQANFILSNLFSIKMHNFLIDKHSAEQENKLLFSDNIDLILTDHSFTLADNVHRIDAEEIGILSTEKRVYVKNAKLYPLILSESFEDMPVTIFADIPEINISDADIFGLFNKGILPVNEVKITKPNIRLLFQKTEKINKIENSKKPALILKELKSITAKKITIDRGSLELASYENHVRKAFANTSLSFGLQQFKIEQKNGDFETSYQNFNIDLSELKFDLPDNIHTCIISSINYQLNKKELIINNVVLKPGNKINLNEKRQYINLAIPQIRVSDFEFEKYFDDKEIVTQNLDFLNPEIKVIDKRIEHKTSFSPYELDMYPKISEYFKLIKADNINVKNAMFEWSKTKTVRLNNININAGDFIIDEKNTNRGKLFNAATFSINIKNLNGKTNNQYFSYELKELTINHLGEFSINNLSLKPLLSELEFAEKNKFQTDYFNIEQANISGTGLDVKTLIEHQQFAAEKLNVALTNASIHRDKTFPLHPEQRPKMPQQAIRDIKIPINISETNISFKQFTYTEIEPGAKKASMVFFTDGNSLIRNFTNQAALLKVNPIMQMNVEAMLMGVGRTNIDIDWDVRSFGNEFKVNAVCHEMPLYLLNPITEPGLKLSVREGINKRMEVYFEANNDSSIGSMRFAYNDLKISVLTNKDGELREDKFLSFLINSVALKSDNPKTGRLMLPAKFVNHRDKQRSVVGYIWQSVYAGIKSTFGLKDKGKNKDKPTKTVDQ